MTKRGARRARTEEEEQLRAKHRPYQSVPAKRRNPHAKPLPYRGPIPWARTPRAETPEAAIACAVHGGLWGVYSEERQTIHAEVYARMREALGDALDEMHPGAAYCYAKKVLKGVKKEHRGPEAYSRTWTQKGGALLARRVVDLIKEASSWNQITQSGEKAADMEIFSGRDGPANSRDQGYDHDRELQDRAPAIEQAGPAHLWHFPDEPGPVHFDAGAAAKRSRLRAALDFLPQRYRDALATVYPDVLGVEKQTQTEVARVHGVTQPTVGRWIPKALEHLGAVLEPFEKGSDRNDQDRSRPAPVRELGDRDHESVPIEPPGGRPDNRLRARHDQPAARARPDHADHGRGRAVEP